MSGFSWRIENFCMLKEKTGQYLDSPDFEIRSLKSKYANIRLYPKGMNEKTCITYKLCLRGSETLENGTGIKFSFTHNNNSVSKSITVTSDNKLDLRHSFYTTEIDGICNVENLFLLQDKVEIECVIESNYNGGSSSVISYDAKTILQVKNFTFDLPLNSYLTTWERGQIFSNIVSLSQQSDKFRFSIKLEDYLKTTESYIAEINKISESPNSTTICCQISLLNADENVILVCDRYLFECSLESGQWKIPFSFSPSAVSHLTFLRCKILISDGTILSNLEPENPTSEKGILTSVCIATEKIGQKLLKKIFEKKMLCDVTLQVGNNQFPAHKCVLGGISDVFAAMFENNMKEKKDSAVNIVDLNADIVDKMLQFVYTGKIENIEVRNLSKLYTAADKYQILELKELCTCRIVETMSMNNVYEIFILADMHQDRVMEEAAFNFVRFNRLEFFSSECWKTFMEQHLKLAAAIMLQFCKNP